jgi:uncharacterized protein (TIGR02266 family)
MTGSRPGPEKEVSTPEKRRFRRVALVERVEAEIGGRPCTVETRNISVGGMLIRSETTAAENETITLKFTLPGSNEEIRVRCAVQHASPGAFMGVRFLDLTPLAAAAIEKFVGENFEKGEEQDGRMARRVPLVAKIEAQAGGFPFIALAENISEGGMLVRTTSPLEEGSVVHLKFTLPRGEKEIAVNGTVRHVTPGYSMGVRFSNIDANDLETIRKFVKSA